MRITRDTRQTTMVGTNKKGQKRSPGCQEQVDEAADVQVKAEPSIVNQNSWILDTAEHLTIGEVYTLCGGADGRLSLAYSWERRSKSRAAVSSEPPECQPGLTNSISFGSISKELIRSCFNWTVFDTWSLLRALVGVAKTCLTKTSAPIADCPKKNNRRYQPLNPATVSVSVPEETRANTQPNLLSPMAEAISPSIATSMESPLQVAFLFLCQHLREKDQRNDELVFFSVKFSRMRQRLRRPLRYGSSLKRGALALTLNKMPGPGVAKSRPGAQPPPVTDLSANLSAPYVVQMRMDGQIVADNDATGPLSADENMQICPISPG